MATINGTNGNDTLNGGAENDTIEGFQGDDTLTGGGVQDTFAVRRGEGTDTITDFGGVGTGFRPTTDVIAGVDTLRFEGAGLSAQNLLLTQDGSNLLLEFEGVEDTGVILENFQLEDLDNLSSLTGASADIGNILFDGQTQIQDSFDVADANENSPRVLNPNTVTFLNDLDNTIEGGNDSNDVINAQGGNDRLQGLSGDDLLRGGLGNDTLIGSGSNLVGDIDTLTGGAGEDRFILSDDTQSFYDDGDSATDGTGDYALITDFNTSEDTIQLTGQQSDYVLGSSPSGLPAGTALYLDGEPDELISIFQESSDLSLEEDYFSFESTDAEDNLGFRVSSAGDVNGDRLDDLLIGVPSGEISVVFGKADGFGTSLSLSTLDGSNGFVINGINLGDNLSLSISIGGDFNGDSFDDLLIGTAGADPNGQDTAGEISVVFGKAEGFGASLDLSTLDGSNGFVITL